MNYSRSMKRKIKKCCWWIFIGLCIGLTPYVFHLADLERGYTSGVGGEIFFPLLPFVLKAIKDSIKDMNETMKGVFENE
ncbi:hypothetical protein SDC9_158439 [bioreactor metagenome]|uniref:Uncharacterized protein n=1 Tax=bioreactor metagenome TaxID=1076179 RepID=A0A645F9T6_9ZZZZ